MATLKQYFETDFTHVVRLQVTFPVNEGQVEAYWLVDFLGYMSYMSCYVPETNRKLDYFLSLVNSLKYGSTSLRFSGKITLPSARQFPGELRIDNQVQLGLHARFFGDPARIAAANVPMSRRVYIYSESNLNDADIAALKSTGSILGHEVQFRSTTHAALRSAQEKPAAFVSYDHRDRDVAQKIAIGLQRLMCSVWYDEYSLAAGANLRDSIEKGIRECTRCIVVLSKNFFSNNGWTKKEFDCNCSPPADQADLSTAVAGSAARMASRAVRPLRRPVATMEQMSA